MSRAIVVLAAGLLILSDNGAPAPGSLELINRERLAAPIRNAILNQVRLLPWGKPWLLEVAVNDGVVELWGPVDSSEEQQAIWVAAESTPGVKVVTDNLYRIPLSAGNSTV